MADNHNTTTEELKKDSVNTAEEVHGSEDAPKKKKKGKKVRYLCEKDR